MLKYSCSADGIEIQAFLSRTIPAFFFVSFFLQAATYRGAVEVRKKWVKVMKFMDGAYFLLLFLFAIIAFILSAQVDTSSKNSTWVSLSSLSKEYYSGSIDNLVVLFIFRSEIKEKIVKHKGKPDPDRGFPYNCGVSFPFECDNTLEL